MTPSRSGILLVLGVAIGSLLTLMVTHPWDDGGGQTHGGASGPSAVHLAAQSGPHPCPQYCPACPVCPACGGAGPGDSSSGAVAVQGGGGGGGGGGECPPAPQCEAKVDPAQQGLCEGKALQVVDSYLTLAKPIVPRPLMKLDAEGYLIAMQAPKIKRFNLDVGVNRGKVTVPWLQKTKDVFVIGIEAQPFLHMMYEGMRQDEVSALRLKPNKYWTMTNNDDARRVQEYHKYRDRALVVPCAVASAPGIVEFYDGAGWNARGGASDVGSLFKFTDGRKEKQRANGAKAHIVRKVRLDDLLRHVPPPGKIIWDTLKIDVQGADVDALISAGDYLRNFMCVSGEFEAMGYALPKDFPMDPKPVLTSHGFVRVRVPQGGHVNQLWMNKERLSEYVASAAQFSCHNIIDGIKNMNGIVAEVQKLIARLR